MKVILFDRKELIVSQAEYLKIFQAIDKPDDQLPRFVVIGGVPYRPKAIAYFEKGGVTEADMQPIVGQKRLHGDHRPSEEQFKSARKASDVARKRLQEIRERKRRDV